MSEDKVSGAEAAFVLLVGLPLQVLWTSYVGAHLWNWFAVPYFGAPVLSVSAAVVGAALVGWARAKTKPSTKEAKSGELISMLFYALVLDTMLLLTAVIARGIGAA